MQNPLDIVRRWRYGGQTGQGMWQSEGKMAGVFLLPFIISLIILPMVLPPELQQFTAFLSFGGLILWVAAIITKAKTDIASLIVFPQTHIRYPDGNVACVDLKFRSEGILEVCSYNDGSKGYKLTGLERYEYASKYLKYPIVYRTFNLKVPGTFDDAFKRICIGETFHENTFVSVPDCDYASIWINGFDKNSDGEYEARGIVNDCAGQYTKFLEKNDFVQPASDPKEDYKPLFEGMRKENDNLLQEKHVLEEALSVAYRIGGEYVKKNVDSTLEAIRSRVHLITDTKEPLWNRILKIAWWKVVVSIGILLIVSHFFLGWP